MTPQSAMIFAAGKGTRMRHLTVDTPKPLIHVMGRALLDHALDIVTGAAVPNVVVNTHYLGQQVRDHLSGRDVTCIHEPTLLETGGGLKNALPSLGPAPVITLNSDAIWTGTNPVTTLCNAWDPSKMDALLLLIPRANASGYSGSGDFILGETGQILRGPGEVYSGAQIIHTEGLAQITDDAFSLNQLWDGMLERGRIFGVLHDGGWCDVGHPKGITIAEDLLRGVHSV